jgi:hypothetical protein
MRNLKSVSLSNVIVENWQLNLVDFGGFCWAPMKLTNQIAPIIGQYFIPLKTPLKTFEFKYEGQAWRYPRRFQINRPIERRPASGRP